MLPRNRTSGALVLFAAVWAVLATNQTLAFAQSVLAIAPESCIFQKGDNPAWAAAALDESGWQPYSSWHADLSQPRLWIRCHASLGSLRGAAHPAIQARLYGAYELYLDGARIGATGNLGTGSFSLNAIRSYPLSEAQIAGQPQVIALRVFSRNTLYNAGRLLVRRPQQETWRFGINRES